MKKFIFTLLTAIIAVCNTNAQTSLVATLNPADSSLRHQVEASAGSPCRFYLAHPRTMEETLDRLFAETPAGPEEGEEGS